MNVSGQMLATQPENEIGTFLTAILPGPRTRYLLFNLSHTSIIHNSDNYFKKKEKNKISILPMEPVALLLIKNKIQNVNGIHWNHFGAVILLTHGNP